MYDFVPGKIGVRHYDLFPYVDWFNGKWLKRK